MLALAERMADDRDALEPIDALPPAVWRRHGETLLTVLREAAHAEPPEQPAPARLEPAQDRLARKLMARLRQLAEHHRVSAPLLATRKDVEALVMGRRDLPLLEGWRRDLAGEELLGLLDAA
jgi:ribonuclease D